MSFPADLPVVASGRALELIKKRSNTIEGGKELVLHGTWFCLYTQRVWITLEELGLDYTFVETGSPFDPENEKNLLELNPEGKSPVLVAGGKPICDSIEICNYLESTYGPKLYPKSHPDSAIARSEIDFISNTLQPAFFSYLSEQIPKNITRKHLLALSHLKAFTLAMRPIPKSLRRTPSTEAYFFGDQFSLVDIFLAPLVARLSFFEEMKDFVVFDPDAGYSTKKGNEWIERWNMWKGAVMMRKSVDDTMSEREGYRKIFEYYASGAE